jgi:hypothetical protein
VISIGLYIAWELKLIDWLIYIIVYQLGV